MSRNFMYDFHLKDRIPLQSLPEDIMNKDVNNSNKAICNKLDLICVIKNYLNNVKDENSENAQDIFKNLKILLDNLRNDHFEYCDNPVIKASKCNSLVSVVDIEMEISDDTNLNKEVKANSLNEIKNINKVYNKYKPVSTYKEAVINTESPTTCDQCVQTPKWNNKIDQDVIQKLGTQNTEVQLLMQTFSRKSVNLLNRKNRALSELLNVIKFYKTYFDKQKIAHSEIGTQTDECWLRDWSMMKECCVEFRDAQEPIFLMTKRNEEMEEKIGLQSQEIQSQFEMVEELTVKNCDLSKKLDLINCELSEVKEVNEFVESENQGLTNLTEKVREDFECYMKLQNRVVEDLQSKIETERCRWTMEKRVYVQNLAEQQHDFATVRQDRQYSKNRMAKMDSSLCGFLDFSAGHETLVAELRASIAAVTESITSQTRDRDRWMMEREAAVKKHSDYEEELNRGVESLKKRFDDLEGSVQSARDENSGYVSCFSDLRMINLRSSERSDCNELTTLCRVILARHEPSK